MENNSLEETINQTIDKLSPDLPAKERQKLAETIENAIAKGIPVRQSLGINDATMEFVYSEGHKLFSTRKYEKAAKVFQVLYLLDPVDPRYALGIAASFQMAKDYEKAVAWYFVLAIIDEKSPLPFYYISDCFIKQNEPAASAEFLKKAMERCGNNPEYESLKARAKMMVETLEAAGKEANK